MLQTVVSAAVSTVALWLASTWRPSLRFSSDSLRNALAFGVGVLGVSLLSPIWDQLAPFLVGVVLGPSDAGQYAVGAQDRHGPCRDRKWDHRDGGASDLLADQSGSGPPSGGLRSPFASLCVAASAAVLVPIAVMGSQLVVALFGPTWQTAGQVCQILAIAQIVGAVAWVDRSVLFAVGRSRVEFLILVAAVASVVGAVFLGAELGGIVGVAVAMAIRQGLFVPIRLAVVHAVAGIEVRRVVQQALLIWVAVGAALLLGFGLSTATEALGAWPQIIMLALASSGGYLRSLADVESRDPQGRAHTRPRRCGARAAQAVEALVSGSALAGST